MLTSRESSVVWVLVVSVSCGGRSVRHDHEGGITLVTGGNGGSAPFGAAGTIAVGGTAPLVETGGTSGNDGTSGNGGTSGTPGLAGTSGLAGSAGEATRDPDPHVPCGDGPRDPLDPTSGMPCAGERPPVDCDALSWEYQVEVGLAQWCERDADCHAGIPVPALLECGCDVIVRAVDVIAPIAAEWRAGGCATSPPCRTVCTKTEPPYVCGEAGFCLDDR
jgi:hypothetical protein